MLMKCNPRVMIFSLGAENSNEMRLMRPLLLLLSLILASPAVFADPLVHVLLKGETIFGVAKTYSVPYEAVLAANGIEDPRKVRPGTRLVIPASHKVVKGETLYGIARAHGITLEELLKANKLSSGAVIKPGDALIIPGGNPASSPASVSTPAFPSTEKPSDAAPPSDTPIKAPFKPAPAGNWPAQGDAYYLEGKLFGVGIRTEKDVPIRAVRSGTVISAGPFRGFGRVALIQAKDGLIYVYGGAQTLSVRIGESVHVGTEIGKVGVDLKEGRPIAYFLVFKKGIPLDPVAAPRE
jgi:lipoprotein NlpD